MYNTEGTPLQGITGGFGGDRRVDHIIPRSAVEAGQYEIVLESSANEMFTVGQGTVEPPDHGRWFQLSSADLVVLNQDAWRLLWDYTTLREISDNLPDNTPTHHLALTLQNRIMNTFRADDPSTIAACRKIAEELLGDGWEAKGHEIYDMNMNTAIYGIGCE